MSSGPKRALPRKTSRGSQGRTKKQRKNVNSKAHHGPKQDPVKGELPRATNTDTRAHKTTGSKPSQKSDTKHIVFLFICRRGKRRHPTEQGKIQGQIHHKRTGRRHTRLRIAQNKNPQIRRVTQRPARPKREFPQGRKPKTKQTRRGPEE